MTGRVNPAYKDFKPKWHRVRWPIFWWLETWPYARFITRELTSLAVAYSALMLLVQVWAVSRGERTYARFLALLRHPLALEIHVAVLAVVLFHAVSWFNLAPKAMVVKLGRHRLSAGAMLAANYAAWLAAWAFVGWVLLGR